MEKRPSNKSRNRAISGGILILAMLTLMFACKKNGTNCFSSAGSIIRQTRNVIDFDTIVARENVDIILTQDSVNSIVVEAGQNIINGIRTEIESRQLIIDNTNTCNWERSYSKPLNVYVHVKNLRKIYYLSAGNITCTNVLTPATMLVDVWGGSGSINLAVNLTEGNFYEHLGTADIIISGKTSTLSAVAGDYGLIQLKDLRSDYCYISNSGTNDCYVNSSRFVDASIHSIGNIYYTGNPDSVHTHIYGSGKVIEF